MYLFLNDNDIARDRVSMHMHGLSPSRFHRVCAWYIFIPSRVTDTHVPVRSMHSIGDIYARTLHIQGDGQYAHDAQYSTQHHVDMLRSDAHKINPLQ